jgi:hypothetical protein
MTNMKAEVSILVNTHTAIFSLMTSSSLEGIKVLEEYTTSILR